MQQILGILATMTCGASFIIVWCGCTTGIAMLWGGDITGMISRTKLHWSIFMGFFGAMAIFFAILWFLSWLSQFFENRFLVGCFIVTESLLLFSLYLVIGSLMTKLIVFIFMTILSLYLFSNFTRVKILQLIQFSREEEV